MRFCPPILIAAVALSSSGCTSDLRAPSNYVADTEAGDGVGGKLTIECGDLPLAAVGAAVVHTVISADGSGDVTFALDDPASVPAGLEIDSRTGEITGVPETAGEGLSFDVVATDSTATEARATCNVDINPELAVQLRVNAPGCLSGSESLNDVVVAGTGDGTPIVCDAPERRGDGRLPTGISVGLDSCQLEGTLQENRFGTWVTVMRGTQSGAEVHVPFCVTNDDPGDFYNVQVNHSGVDGNTLTPMIGIFNPNADFALGMPGDPHFTVDDAEACGIGSNSCSFGFNYSATSSHFNGNDVNDLVAGDELFRDDAGTPIGMQHDLVPLSGNNLPEEARDRPWALTIGLDYCLAEDLAECTGPEIQANAGARFQFSIIMFPDPA